MPRIRAKRTDYKLKDFTKWVKVQMLEQDMSQVELADLLGVTQPGISYKLKTNTFTLKDIIIMMNTFNPEAEELKKLLC